MAQPMRPMRVPHSRPTKINLDSGSSSEGGGKTWVLVLLILLIFGGAVGTYIWFHGLKKEPPPEVDVPPPPKPIEKPPAPPPPTEPEKPTEPEPPPPPPKKSVQELKAEADAAQKELDAKIAEARKASVGKELPGFAGAKFGDRVKGVPIGREKLPGTEGLADGGYGYKMRGPVLKAPFRSFGNQPMVWVTPKTYQIYRIEFSRALNRSIGPFSKVLNHAPGTMPDPDTTNLVATLAKKLHRDPFSLDPEKFPLGRREYVFPFGSTTLTVSEPGGDMQKLVVENEGMYDQVRAEAAAERKEELKREVKDKWLSSDKYPSSGSVKMGSIRLKKGTIRHFCGLSFGNLPPYGAKIERPAKGTCAFFIDYRKAKCRPFLNFEHGRAEIGRSNQAILAIELHSEGSADGLTDEEFYDRVRKTLEARYGVQPRETKGEGTMPTLVYGVGDTDLTFGPDAAGGFRLRVENTVLKALW